MRTYLWRRSIGRALAIALSAATVPACVDTPDDEPPPATTAVARTVGTCGPTGFAGWSFDQGVTGWSATGTAFGNQPTYGDNVLISRTDGGSSGFRPEILDEIGGNYWKVPMRIGRVGDGYLGTYEDRSIAVTNAASTPAHQAATRFKIRGDGARGWLRSEEFVIGSDYISLMLGGGAVPRERVELLVKTASLCPAGGCFQALRTEGEYAVVAAVMPSQSSEQMRRIVLHTSELRGAMAQLRIIDDTSTDWGHLNVDDIRCDNDLTASGVAVASLSAANVLDAAGLAAVQPVSLSDFDIAYGGNLPGLFPPANTPPKPPPKPTGRLLRVEQSGGPEKLFGLADVHAHLMMELGFGGNVIFGHFTDGMGRLIDGCGGEDGHWPGFQGLEDEEVHTNVLDQFERVVNHINRGIGSNTHNQVTFEALKRAWEGGLRLVTLQATHHQPLEWLIEADRADDGRSTEDIIVIQQQIARAKQLFVDSRDSLSDPRLAFAQIVYTPAEARAVIASGRLAVLLGVETADVRTGLRYQLVRGRYAPFFAGGDSTNPEHDVDVYYALGVRQVTPIHAVNNAVGGAAMFEKMYEMAQYLSNGERFAVSTDGAPAAGEPWWRVHYESSSYYGLEALCGFFPSLFAGGDYTPFPMVWRWFGTEYRYVPSQPWCQATGIATGTNDHNDRGLELYGRRYLKRMMHYGMLIDTDHMSRITRDAVYGSLLAQVQWVARYPTLSSHSDFSDLLPAGTEEERRTAWELNEIRVAGGMVAPIPNTVGRSGTRAELDQSIGARSNRFTDCGGTADDFAAKMSYAIDRMGGRGVALGSDWNSPSSKRLPRFGYFSAYWSPLAGSPPLADSPTEANPIDGAKRSLTGVAGRACGMNPVDRGHKNGVCYDDYGQCAFDGQSSLPGNPRGQIVVRAERNVENYDVDLVSTNDWEPVPEIWRRGEVVPTSGTPDTFVAPDGTPRSNWDAPLKRWRPETLWVRNQAGPVLDEIGRPRTTVNLREERGFDINTDRLTTAGLLPDFLQELHNVGMTPEELGTLMYSAEDYVQMWERAQQSGAALEARGCLRVSGCAP
jgi:microsomal dipeptidase-like Zn-dependent dipeptidase